MAKFCGQCGAQLNDNATFCTQCGATIAPQQPAQQTASPMAAKNIDMNAIKDAVSVENIKNLKNKPNKLTIAVLAVLLVLVILVVVILCMIFGGGSWKTPINNVMDVLNDGDGKAYEELMPPYYKDMADALDGIIDISDEDFDEEAEKQRDRLTKKYGDDAEISYEVVKKTKVDSDDIDSYNESADQVVLMTIHSAKGLEFPYVFLIGMEEGVFPSEMSKYSEADLEEERRLAYVGITRAKKELYISNSVSRMLYGRTQRNEPSRFLREIEPEYIEETRSPVLEQRLSLIHI